jgi:hypothetical protein
MTVRAALPAGAVTSYQSWLLYVIASTASSSVNIPFLVEFALLEVPAEAVE